MMTRIHPYFDKRNLSEAQSSTHYGWRTRVRLVPEEALWPIAHAILSDFNTAQTLHVCGYPKLPTLEFQLVLLALVKRNPVAFQPYIEGRIRACCGDAQAAWFLHHIEAGAKPPEASQPKGVQPRASKKRKREGA